ncbi:MAG: ribonuclease P protein component, partial [Anaerolineales bacterium]|nr:ribonuclease P protein component [Anaerolineales bacterium]
NAVKRNRAKRLVRAAMRELHPQIPAGWNLVVIARAPIIQTKMSEVRAALQTLLQRAKLFNDE